MFYVPSWTHPNHSDSVIVQYDGKRFLRGTADPLPLLRPAMLASDVLRNPTPYATRFGIHPDEIGGRSRLSPSASHTPNPLEDYQTQVALLNDQERNQAIEETRRRGTTTPTEQNPDIALGVLDEMYARAGVLTGPRLKDHIGKSLIENWNNDDWSGIDGIVERLKNGDPAVLNANRNFFDRIRREQDWQRMMFHGLTTDELIQNNIHTITSTQTSDLKGPLHR